MNKNFRLILLATTLVAGILGALAWTGSLARAGHAAAFTAMTVDTLEDELNSDGDCSLREAIEAANTNAPADDCPPGSPVNSDTITFNVAGTITLTDQLLVSAGGPLIIDGDSDIIVSGGSAVRIFQVGGGVELILREITITQGRVMFRGGGVYNSGHLIILDSAITRNTSFREGVGMPAAGGGIYNNGILEIDQSTLSWNTAVGVVGNDRGGGILNNGGVVTITNSTISANSAHAGGGIYNFCCSIAITNSSITGNGIDNIINSGVITMTNSIVAYSPSGINCSGPTIDGGYNLEDADTCGFDPANGSLINTDPMLGPLQDNGGPTWTQALLAGSPAIDAGDDTACPPTVQRGVARPQDGNGDGVAICDIGAYEFEQGIGLIPTTLAGSGAPGETILYSIELFNYTALTDSYSLALGGNTWQTVLSPSTIGPLAPGASQSFNVAVSIPPEAEWYQSDAAVVTATSMTGPNAYTATARISTQAYAPPQISVSPLTLTSTQNTDAVTTQTLTIGNGFGVTLTFSVTTSQTTAWLAIDPVSGTVPTSSSTPIQVTFDATNLLPSVYTTTLQVESNDPLSPDVQVPMTMTVLSEGIWLEPAYQGRAGSPGSTLTYTLQLYNYTSLTDTYALTTAGNAWQTSLSADSLGPLTPGSSQVFSVTVNIPSDAKAPFTDIVVITSTSLTSPAEYSDSAQIATFVLQEWKTYLPQIIRGYSTLIGETSGEEPISSLVVPLAGLLLAAGGCTGWLLKRKE